MQESLLHFIWQYQKFDKQNLLTIDNKKLNIINPGKLNNDSGPDFNEAIIIIDGIEWRGSVEIHVNSSDWIKHGHDKNEAYEVVILHVVWTNNTPIFRSDHSHIPTLQLSDKISKEWLSSSLKLVETPRAPIPCVNYFASVSENTKHAMLNRLIEERLLQKRNAVYTILKETKGDWDETSYRLLFKCVGLKINSIPFYTLAQKLPFKIVRKYQNEPVKVESLLFGVAGFLGGKITDEYHQTLKNEFAYLSHKHSLKNNMKLIEWKFMRLRPPNFPTVRLAQLSAIVTHNFSFFDILINEKLIDIRSSLSFPVTQYWKTRYDFGKKSKRMIQGLGDATKNLIIINVVVPILSSYGKSIANKNFEDKAINYLQNTSSEFNKIINIYKNLGLESNSASSSQAMLQWYNHYCSQKRCFNCSIGAEILNKSST